MDGKIKLTKYPFYEISGNEYLAIKIVDNAQNKAQERWKVQRFSDIMKYIWR